jgi:hypothetical protein
MLFLVLEDKFLLGFFMFSNELEEFPEMDFHIFSIMKKLRFGSL